MDELEAQVEAAKYAANFLSRNSKILIKVWDGVKVKAKAKANLEATYSEYLESSCKHLARTKPSIFGAEPIPLYDFYVPLDVKLGKREVLESVDYQSLAGILPQGRAVISGTAGGGKSVLMRHLFISALKNGHHIPVFLELRKVNQDRLPLKVMIGKALQLFNFNSGGSIDEYVDLALEKGHFALILDGYDEVDLDHKQKLTKELLELSAGAPDCFVVISTRPDESIQGWDGFSNLSLQPLSKGQALQLVDNLPYDNAVKSKFSRGCPR